MPHSLVNQIPVRRFRLHHRDQADAGRGSTRAALWSLPLPWTAHSPRGASRSSAIGDGASVPGVATGRGSPGAGVDRTSAPSWRKRVGRGPAGSIRLRCYVREPSWPTFPCWRRRVPHRAGQSISVSTLKRGRDGTRTTTTCSLRTDVLRAWSGHGSCLNGPEGRRARGKRLRRPASDPADHSWLSSGVSWSCFASA
jgi:hypothetical protein